MDCVRRSVETRHSKFFDTDYKLVSQGEFASDCEKRCISQLKCKFWKYKPNEYTCYLSENNNVTGFAQEPWEPDVVSGRVECTPQFDIFPLVFILLIAGVFCLALWKLKRGKLDGYL